MGGCKRDRWTSGLYTAGRGYAKLIFHSCALHLTIAEQEEKQILMNCGAEKASVCLHELICIHEYVYFCIRPHSVTFWLHYTINGASRRAPHWLTNYYWTVSQMPRPTLWAATRQHTDTRPLSARHTMDGFGRLGISKDSMCCVLAHAWCVMW